MKNMKNAPRYGTQGGGMVVAAGKGRYVFISDPPTGFKIGDYMPEEWGIAGPFNSQGKQIEEPESMSDYLDLSTEDKLKLLQRK